MNERTHEMSQMDSMSVSIRDYFDTKFLSLEKKLDSIENRLNDLYRNSATKDELKEAELKIYQLTEENREQDARIFKVENDTTNLKRTLSIVGGVVVALILSWLKQFLGL